jgi:hypothetical protein
MYFDGCNLGDLFVHYATVHFVVKIRDDVVVFCGSRGTCVSYQQPTNTTVRTWYEYFTQWNPIMDWCVRKG